MSLFPPQLLSDTLDDSVLPALDSLIEYFAPESPYLTFDAPGVAHALSSYGRTVLAHRPRVDEWRLDEALLGGVEVRFAGPSDPLAFPPGRFGLVHARWARSDPVVLSNLTRWLRPGGVLLVEAPDWYPAGALQPGPYRTVVQAAMKRINLPDSLDLPARLMRHGLRYVGCRHEAPIGQGFHELLKYVLDLGAPWPEIDLADLQNWKDDPAARIQPAVMNILAWGMKSPETPDLPIGGFRVIRQRQRGTSSR